MSRIDFNIFSCGSAALSIWKVTLETPPNASLWRSIFSATSSGLPTINAPVGPVCASYCARVIGAQPRSLPILVNTSAYPGKKSLVASWLVLPT